MAAEDSVLRSSCRGRRAPALIDLTDIRVLVVDDDLEQLDIVSELLADANAEVIIAASAHEAIEKLVQSTPT